MGAALQASTALRSAASAPNRNKAPDLSQRIRHSAGPSKFLQQELPEASALGVNRKGQMAEQVRVFEWRDGGQGLGGNVGPERRGDRRSW